MTVETSPHTGARAHLALKTSVLLLLALSFPGRSALAEPAASGVSDSSVPNPPAGEAASLPSEGAPPACTDSPESCGKRAFEGGIEAFEAEDYPTALRLFREAQALRPHPTILFNVALAEAKLGQVISALEHLEAVFRDPATPGGLLERVRAEREQVGARLAEVSVEKSGATLFVDGVRAPGDPPRAKLDPGGHQLRVVVDGRTVLDQAAVLEPGERVRLTITEPPTSREPLPPPPPPAPSVEPRPARPPRPLGPAWVVGGGAASLLLAGLSVWSGLDTRRSYQRYEEDIDRLTEPQAHAQMDEGLAKQRRSNVLLGVTAVMAVATTATAFTLVEWSPGASARGSALRLQLRPAFLAIDGRF